MASDNRLIDANAFRKQLEDIRQEFLEEDTMSSNFAAEVIETVQDEYLAHAPTVDAVEVVHGRWIPADIDIDEYEQCLSEDADWYDWQCSVCYYRASYVDPVKRRHLANYCPNCGAKMDGGNHGP